MHAIQKMNALMLQAVTDINNNNPQRASGLIKECLTLLTTNNMIEFAENYQLLASEKKKPIHDIFQIVPIDKENYLKH